MTGYKSIPSTDPVEGKLRAAWYAARSAIEAENNDVNRRAFEHADGELVKYLWDRVQKDVAADRAKHPKAKRNQPVLTREVPPYAGLPGTPK